MALPDFVAEDEFIETQWGNDVVETLTRYVNSDSWSSVTIPGNVDASGGSLTNWLVGGIDIPTWASKANLVTTVAGLFQTGASNGAFELQTSLAGIGGNVTKFSPVGADVRDTQTWCDHIDFAATGAQNIAVLARRVAGSSVLRVDASSSVRFVVRFIA